MARTVGSRTRPALLEAARDLFYSRGVGLTGVDDIARASGLAKPTLYRHFTSKETLVAAYLQDRHQRLQAELRAGIEGQPPERRPQAVIDWLADWLSSPGFNGCAFVRTYAEMHDDESVRDMARMRKRALSAAIEEACQAAGVDAPAELAEELALIVEGATTMVFVTGEARPAIDTATRLARLALAAAGLPEN